MRFLRNGLGGGCFFKNQKKTVIVLFEQPADNDNAYKVRLFYLHFYFRRVLRTTSARRQGGLRSCATRARRVRARVRVRVRRPPRADGDPGAQGGSGSNVMSSREGECQTWEGKVKESENWRRALVSLRAPEKFPYSCSHHHATSCLVSKYSGSLLGSLCDHRPQVHYPGQTSNTSTATSKDMI